jgi:methionyl-tRNA formyltransferase
MSKRVIFFGTPKIAVSCLKALLDENINVVAVVTKVDKLTGRRQEIQKSEVKIFAQKHQITVLQPEKVNDIYDQLISLKPDLFVVCAYGKLIGEKILNIPKYHCINIHTSLLPR